MHVRRDRKRVDGDRPRTYVSLAHSVWSMGRNGKKKQSRPVVFARLGAEEDLQPELVRGMRSALDKLLEQLLAREAEKNGTPPQPPPAAETPAVVEALASKVRVHEAGLRMLTSRELGVRRVVEAVWKRLGLDEVIQGFAAQHRLSFDLERVVFAMVLNRLVDPGSKRACNQWIQEEVWFPEGEDWDVHHFYRALDALEQHSDALSDAILASSRRRLPAEELRLLLVDTTSTFFASDLDDVERATVAADWEAYDAGERDKPPSEPRPQVVNDPPLRMRGHSKDHRPNKPQIVIGLVAGKGGRVLRHRVYPGNRQDQRVSADLLQDARALAPTGRVVVVADSGMSGEPNLARLDALEPPVDRITAVPLRSLRKAEEVLSQAGRWRKHPTKPHMTVRVVEIEGSSPSGRPEVFIATRNATTAASQTRVLEKNIARVKAQLAKSGGVDEHGVATCQMIAKPAQRRLVRVSADGRRLVLDQDAIRRERRLAGVRLLRTTLTDIDPIEAIDAYQGLLAVEDDFHQFKGPLQLRPMHHRRDERIRAHVMVCVLALVVKQELERLTEMSLRDVVRLVQRVTAAKMSDGGREFWMRGEWPEEALPVLQKLGVRQGPRSWAVGSGSTSLEESGTT
jgi:transposase